MRYLKGQRSSDTLKSVTKSKHVEIVATTTLTTKATLTSNGSDNNLESCAFITEHHIYSDQDDIESYADEKTFGSYSCVCQDDVAELCSNDVGIDSTIGKSNKIDILADKINKKQIGKNKRYNYSEYNIHTSLQNDVNNSIKAHSMDEVGSFSLIAKSSDVVNSNTSNNGNSNLYDNQYYNFNHSLSKSNANSANNSNYSINYNYSDDRIVNNTSSNSIINPINMMLNVQFQPKSRK